MCSINNSIISSSVKRMTYNYDMQNKARLYLLIVTTVLIVITTTVYIFKQTNVNMSLNRETTEEIESNSEPSGIFCDNHSDIEYFETPVPVIWTSIMDGCLVSCQGGSFTSLDEDATHPRFAGYNPGKSEEYDSSTDNPIPDEYVGQNVTVTGDWIGIDADHALTVFDGRCVPIVNIKEITPML